MNNIKIIKTDQPKPPVQEGQIYRHGMDFYIVIRKDDFPVTGCLVNIKNGYIWRDAKTAEQIIHEDENFVLFKGTLQITAE